VDLISDPVFGGPKNGGVPKNGIFEKYPQKWVLDPKPKKMKKIEKIDFLSFFAFLRGLVISLLE